MKTLKSFIALCAIIAVPFNAMAQEEVQADSATQKLEALQKEIDTLTAKEEVRTENEHLAKIWKQRKYFNISYVSQNVKNLDAGGKDKSKFGVALQLGKTFALHKKPIANMVKIGLDWNYVDLNYVKYKNGSGIDLDMGDYDYDNGFDLDDYYGDDFDEPYLDIDLGMHQVEYGMSIGPSVQVTPLYHIGKGWEYLKVFTYFHYTPSYSLIIYSEDDETELNHGFCSFFNFGIGLSYKNIGIGFESRWGQGKYKMAELDEDDLDDGISFDDKQKFKTTSSRVYISLRF